MTLPSDPAPLGFGRCGGADVGVRCAYYWSGGVQICYPCALREITRPPANSCPVCSQRLGFDEPCRNWLCRNDRSRHFRQVHAVGLKKGTLNRVLIRYKEFEGWAPVLARILVGWLGENRDALPEDGLITGMPHAPGEHGREYMPLELILRLAYDEDPSYPFDYRAPRAVVKTEETPSMTGQPLMRRRRIAQEEIYPAVEVTDKQAVAGRDVLVIDDFFTTGFTCNQVARRLREAGATAVDILVFARALWQWPSEKD